MAICMLRLHTCPGCTACTPPSTSAFTAGSLPEEALDLAEVEPLQQGAGNAAPMHSMIETLTAGITTAGMPPEEALNSFEGGALQQCTGDGAQREQQSHPPQGRCPEEALDVCKVEPQRRQVRQTLQNLSKHFTTGIAACRDAAREEALDLCEVAPPQQLAWQHFTAWTRTRGSHPDCRDAAGRGAGPVRGGGRCSTALYEDDAQATMRSVIRHLI